MTAPPLASAQSEPTPILGAPTVVTPLVTSLPSATDAPLAATAESASATATPAARLGPDACEPNDSDAQPCALALDAVSGPFTFVPETDRDVYALDLPDDPAIQTVVTVRATAGLDLFVSARQGPTLLASGTISLTLVPAIHGPVLLRVENRDPRPAAGESYRIEVRREIAPRASDQADLAGAPDALENTWSFATAAPIAVGVVYDLTLVCPEVRPDACPGGDHDYLRVPVKAGVAYRIATFDLDHGVDTVVEVFWQRQDHPVAGNDDYAPGGLLSALTWVAPADGLADIRIAPRNGGLTPQLVSPTHAAYRFVVAPVASELARTLEPTLRQQANIPTPTATVAPSTTGSGGATGAAGSGSAAGAAVPGSQEQITAGPAILVRATVLRHEPRPDSTALADLPAETRVAVRGPVRGLWVSVAADASILPGWVLWSDLRRIDANAPLPTSTGAAPAPSVPTGAAPVQQPSAAGLPALTATDPAPTGARVEVTTLDPALPAAAPPPGARVPVLIAVTIVATDHPPTGGSTFGMATPTPDMSQPVRGVRVQIANAFGDVLAEGLTDASGAVQLSRDLRPTEALQVVIPAWGLTIPLASGQIDLILTVPEAHV